MMTIVTHVKLKPGSEPEWDAAMRERLSAATGQPSARTSALVTGLMLTSFTRPSASTTRASASSRRNSARAMFDEVSVT